MSYSSDEDEDCVTPRYSPVLMISDSNEINNNNFISRNNHNDGLNIISECLECNLSSRRYPITSEKDLYHRTPLNCRHDKQNMIRSSSALTFLEHNKNDINENLLQPPKFTSTLTSNRKEVIRPIACKPIVPRNRRYDHEGPINQLPERHGLETTIGNSCIATQRFGGSLCNVVPTELHLRREVSESVPHIVTNTSSPTTKPERPRNVFSNRKWYESSKKLEKFDLERQSNHMQENQQQNVENDQGHLQRELNSLRGQLDEANWSLCHRKGEMELLTAKLKDSQGKQITRNNELVQLRTLVKDLNAEITTLRAQLSQAVLSFRSKEKENALLKQKLAHETNGKKETSVESELIRSQLKDLELKYSNDRLNWEREKQKWIDEQDRVLRYQKALQHCYMLTCRKVQNLATQLESFSSVSV